MTLPESLLKRPAALIFDMDGTLLDTEPLYTIANQKVLDVYGVTFTMALKQACMGGDSKRSARIVIDHFGLPLSAEEYLAKREIHLLQLFEETPEIAGAANFIHMLAESGIPFGLATSSHQHLYSIKLADKVWGDMFHQVVCGDNKDLSNGKPAPDIFLLCAKKLGVDPKECIAFEDSGNGVAAARAAGMQVVAIDSPYAAEGSLDDAQLKISHYDEILPLLAQWQTQS